MMDPKIKEIIEEYLEMRIHSKTQNIEQVVWAVMQDVKDIKNIINKLTDALIDLMKKINEKSCN